MKITYLSDVHCEFHRDKGKSFVRFLANFAIEEGVEAIIIAGDFATHNIYVERYSELCSLAKGIEVVAVNGNHELYASNRGVLNNNKVKLEKRFSNLHILDKEVFEFKGQRFLGATLWFRNHPENPFYERHLNDFFSIQGFDKWVYPENAACIKFFEDNMKEGDICISHHAPSAICIRPEFKHAIGMNRFYVTDLTNLIFERQPAVFVNGHLHSQFEEYLGQTKMLCNPHGYVGHELRSQEFEFVVLEV